MALQDPEALIEHLTGCAPEDVALCARDDLEAARQLLNEALVLQTVPGCRRQPGTMTAKRGQLGLVV